MNPDEDEEIKLIKTTNEPTIALRNVLQEINFKRYSIKEFQRLSNFKKFVKIAKPCPFLNQKFLEIILQELIFNNFETSFQVDDDLEEKRDDNDDDFQKMLMKKMTEGLFDKNYLQEEEEEDFIEEFDLKNVDNETCDDNIGDNKSTLSIHGEPLFTQNDFSMKYITEWIDYSCRKDTKRVFYLKVFRFCLVLFSRFDFSKQIKIDDSYENSLRFQKSIQDCFQYINMYPYSLKPKIINDIIIYEDVNEDKSLEIIFGNQIQQDFLSIFMYPNGKPNTKNRVIIDDIKNFLSYPLLEHFAYICFPPYNNIDELVCFLSKKM